MSKNKKNRKIIFVHGKNTKPIPAEHRELLLKSLRAGFAESQFGDEMLAFDDDSFVLCAWSDLLYSDYEKTHILRPAVERLIHQPRETHNWPITSRLAVWVRRFLYLLVDYCPALIKFLWRWWRRAR